MLYGKQVILASVYAPNWDDHKFVTSLFSTIPNLDSNLLIMEGDMNCVLDPILEKSNSRPFKSSKMSQALSTVMNRKLDLQRWNYLPLSLAVSIQIIKMNVLPRYLYIFQCLPFFLPKSFLGMWIISFHLLCGPTNDQELTAHSFVGRNQLGDWGCQIW